MTSRSRFRRRGFTLIELLCVIGIIAILLSLLAGPIYKALFKARTLDWEFKGPNVIEDIAERLRRFTQSLSAYPALTADELRRLGVFDDRIMEFLRSDTVEFFPFASSDAENKLILRVSISEKTIHTLLKKDLKPLE